MKDLPKTTQVRLLTPVSRGIVIEGIEAAEISRITGIPTDDEVAMRSWCAENAAYFYTSNGSFDYDEAAQKASDRGLNRVVFFRLDS